MAEIAGCPVISVLPCFYRSRMFSSASCAPGCAGVSRQLDTNESTEYSMHLLACVLKGRRCVFSFSSSFCWLQRGRRSGAGAAVIGPQARRSLGSWHHGTALPSGVLGLTLEREINFHFVKEAVISHILPKLNQYTMNPEP